MTAIAAADHVFVTRLPEPIVTDRLVLRAPNRGDAVAMARLANNRNIHKWLARLPNPYGEADAVHFIDCGARSADEHAYAVATDDGGFIGVIGLQLKSEAPVELGYWLGEPYWGLGYGSEAVDALVAAADRAGCDRIAARALSSNRASRRVLEKSGFVETAERIDDCGPRKGVSVAYYLRERLRCVRN
ncbi:MAG: GNAT family N-acetyltransferase [Alphaproteobacteria bacterium]|nr:GNAT family N-acetyltransferase [Alphaproteobacteria bacterium]